MLNRMSGLVPQAAPLVLASGGGGRPASGRLECWGWGSGAEKRHLSRVSCLSIKSRRFLSGSFELQVGALCRAIWALSSRQSVCASHLSAVTRTGERISLLPTPGSQASSQRFFNNSQANRRRRRRREIAIHLVCAKHEFLRIARFLCGFPWSFRASLRLIVGHLRATRTSHRKTWYFSFQVFL